ncbi:MAG: hypothetical protein ACTFAK_09745 [Candidatus Electronema sp. VV]
MEQWECADHSNQNWDDKDQVGPKFVQVMQSDQYLWGDYSEYIISADRRFKLIMQGDCNLVLYQGSTALWSSGTHGDGNKCWAIMQGDGNLVVYKSISSTTGRAVWAAGTHGNPGAYVTVQNDGNTVVYKNNKALWASDTVVSSPNSGTGSHPHPGCTFSRTDTKCYGLVMVCNNIWSCGWDYGSMTPIEESDGWGACGVCFGFDF